MKGLGSGLLTCCCVLVLSGCSIAFRPSLGLRGANEQTDFLIDAVQLNPDNAHAWFFLGKEYMADAEYVEARRCFGRALKVQSDFAEAEFGIALTFLEEEKWKEAEKRFAEITAKRPESSAAWDGMAAARLGQGDLDGAEKAAQRALELQPDSRRAETILGRVAYVRGDYVEAAKRWRLGRLEEQDKATVLPIAQDLERYLEQYGE
ncbi:MAG: Tetratricopeptide repeat [Candidatus Sumerlaeota bacterium]|nr:Tetratricopeptide repeat [Candidatus Sumerlaeota bacterium]